MDGALTCVFADPATVAHPLGVIEHGTRAIAPEVRPHPAKSPVVGLEVVADAAEAFTEVWTTNRPVVADRVGGIAYGHDGEYAFCAGHVPAAARCAPGVRDAYLAAFGVLADLGYPHVFRMWNSIGRINGVNADGLEVYRDFCRGRAEAFDRSPLPHGELPAGTGVGMIGDGVAFFLLARRSPGHLAVENRQQVAAYRYPQRYGPRPPLFSRATCVPDGGLFISGTASILGHETAHEGDVVAQCRTTLDNLAALTDGENLSSQGVAAGRVATRAVKVYVRRRRDLDAVREQCRAAFGQATGVAYLVTDLCRTDLLVEIEAHGTITR